MKSHFAMKLIVLAGLAMATGAAQAGILDATVMINRAANNRTLTVRYDGATAVLVELRINGVGAATRSVSDTKASGETSFTLDLASLETGDNVVEIILYNADGKVVGSEKTTVNVDRSGVGPVFLEKPRQGATIQGPVEISLGLRQELKNIFVSFFIDDQLMVMKNFPPYTYLWDTLRIKNGWHEVQAWVVDKNNNTFKTEKMRVFVNNPGGRTDRQGEGESAPVGNNIDTNAGGMANGLRLGNGGKGTASDPQLIAKMPSSVGPIFAANTIMPAVGQLASTKSTRVAGGQAAGQQTLRPILNAKAPEAPVKSVSNGNKVVTNPELRHAANVPGVVAINYGSRVPVSGAFKISLNGQAVNFDVEPRVQDGIPLTPFRHLFEQSGGNVKWLHDSKEVSAEGMGQKVWFQVGSDLAKVNDLQLRLELAPFIERGRVLVPMSFLVDSLNVKVDFDAATGHVFVTSNEKN